jgi:hypothetical protein
VNQPATANQPPAANQPLAGSGSRVIPAHVRREVWARDGGRCTFEAPDGTRCGSRWKLEFDHVVPNATDGPATVANLRLRCRTHNLLHAEQVFGRRYMARFRACTEGEVGAEAGTGTGAGREGAPFTTT